MVLTPTQQAMALAQAGHALHGLELLREQQRQGNASAYLLEGLWLIEGRFLPRDLEAGRARLRDAAERGHAGAARSLSGMIACGVGGKADWQEALQFLRMWAERDPIAAAQLDLIRRMALKSDGSPTEVPQRRNVSTDPRIERIDGLLTPDECTFLVELAMPRMKRATIFHEGLGRFVEDPVRRSQKAGFPIVSEWPFVRAINLRIAAATETEVSCGEPLQVLRYEPGEEYRSHVDTLAGMDNPRVLTALVWLNQGYSGGETRFEQLDIAESGQTGDCILFANVGANGDVDPRMRHAGAPVTAGTKYLASRWIRARPAGEAGFGRHEIERS